MSDDILIAEIPKGASQNVVTAIRDALDRLDRKQFNGVTKLEASCRREVPAAPQHFADDGGAA
jgi:hypothetical protein